MPRFHSLLALLCATVVALSQCCSTAHAESVSSYITRKCRRRHIDTSGLIGLSKQLLTEVNCEVPNTFSDWSNTKYMSFTGGGVLPYGQEVMRVKLASAAKQRGRTMKFTSVTRSIAQQLALYEWKRRGNCGQTNPVALPGRSKHNGGLAIDISSARSWDRVLRPRGFRTIRKDPPHFYLRGLDVRKLSVRAFQRLWNLNNPNDPIKEDGLYATQTRKRLLRSPTTGFSKGSSCTGEYARPDDDDPPVFVGDLPKASDSIPVSAMVLLNFIGDIEAPQGYDTIYGNKQSTLRTPVTKMTVGSLLKVMPVWSRKHGSSATGRYQFMKHTLEDLIAQKALKTSEVFTKRVQDRLAYFLLNRRRFDRYVASPPTISRNEFGRNLAKEWASLPVLVGCKGSKRSVSRGQSYYAGDKRNKALVAPEDVEKTLRLVRDVASGKVTDTGAPSKPGVAVPGVSVAVVAGDTGWGLVERCHISWARLQSLNPQVDWTKVLRIGQVIQVGDANAASKPTKRYKVQPKQGAWSISRACGISVARLQQINMEVNFGSNARGHIVQVGELVNCEEPRSVSTCDPPANAPPPSTTAAFARTSGDQCVWGDKGVVAVDCGDDKIQSVSFATYSKTDGKDACTADADQEQVTYDTTCHSETALSILKSTCLRRRSCSLAPAMLPQTGACASANMAITIVYQCAQPAPRPCWQFPVGSMPLTGVSPAQIVMDIRTDQPIVGSPSGASIAAPVGTAVYAIAGGTIARVFRNVGHRLDVVVVEHVDPLTGEAVYASYSRLKVSDLLDEGESIVMGQSLGVVGDSQAFGVRPYFMITLMSEVGFLSGPLCSDCGDPTHDDADAAYGAQLWSGVPMDFTPKFTHGLNAVTLDKWMSPKAGVKYFHVQAYIRRRQDGCVFAVDPNRVGPR